MLWNDTAQALFGRFGVDAPLMVVVLDDQQRLAGVIPLPNAPEAMQLYADIDNVVEKISPRK